MAVADWRPWQLLPKGPSSGRAGLRSKKDAGVRPNSDIKNEYTLHVQLRNKKSMEARTCWEWSKQEFWKCFKWDEEDYFWYYPLKDKKKAKPVKNKKEYTTYAAWGKKNKARHAKKVVAIEHQRGKEEMESDGAGER